MNNHGSVEETIFHAAMALPTAEARAAYLQQTCGDDVALRQRVEALLRNVEDTKDFLEEPAVGARASKREAAAAGPGAANLIAGLTEKPGDLISHYKLLEQIGEGGCGVVYMAEQEEPIRRRVALKVIKLGMDTKDVIARFEAERQALALMDHENIARVFDAGATATGRPYFVMELVRGIKITDYCDQNNLSTRARLDLFVKVCQAIQHAHQKGIIHRDIKPSNILVTLHDGEPVPKVIDFGIAKATGQQRLTDKTLFTAFRQFMGTPAYMSPEQAEMTGLDIDTRSDIYSLGVLLYELLTGQTPFDAKELLAAGLDEMRRTIREKEPLTPSTRLSTMLDGDRTTTARRRQTEPAKLIHAVRGDLDWIVMKCLEKDRTRRYETANGLAKDVERHLNDEPVWASPPSKLYRVRKFARKHRTEVLVTASVLLLLVAAVAVSVSFGISAEQARVATLKALNDVETQRGRAVSAEAEAIKKERKAQDSAVQLQAVLDFFQDKVLKTTRPKGQEGGLRRDVTIREALDAAEPGIAKAFADQPLVEESIRNVMGITYKYLDELPKAIHQHERELALSRTNHGATDTNTLIALDNLACAYLDAGRVKDALPLLESAVAVGKETRGSDDENTLNAMNSLACAYQDDGQPERAIKLFETIVEVSKAKYPFDDPQLLTSMNNLAMGYLDSGRLREAVPLLEQVLQRRKVKPGPDHPDTLISMHNLGTAYNAADRMSEALKLHEKALELSTVALGADHQHTLTAMNDLGVDYLTTGRAAEAIPLFTNLVALHKAKLGPDHANTLNMMGNLAAAYREAGQATNAIPLLEELVDARVRIQGRDDPRIFPAMNNLALAYQDASRPAESLATLEKLVGLSEARFGADNPGTIVAMNNLGVGYAKAGRRQQAVAIFEKTVKLSEEKLGLDHMDTLIALGQLARNYQALGRFADALPLLEKRLERTKSKSEPGSPDTQRAMSELADVYVASGQFAQAEPLLQSLVGLQAKQSPANGSALAATQARLGDCLLRLDKPIEAEKLARACLRFREEQMPDEWVTFNSRSLVGACLLGQRSFAEAEQFLLTGYEGMKQREAAIPTTGRIRLTEALQRLVRLYEVWDKASPSAGKAAQAAEWRQKLQALNASDAQKPSATPAGPK